MALLDIGDEVSELYEEYKSQFIDLCRQVFEVGQKHYTIRHAEVEHFAKSIEKAKQDNQQESIGYMESFLGKLPITTFLQLLEIPKIGDLVLDAWLVLNFHMNNNKGC